MDYFLKISDPLEEEPEVHYPHHFLSELFAYSLCTSELRN